MTEPNRRMTEPNERHRPTDAGVPSIAATSAKAAEDSTSARNRSQSSASTVGDGGTRPQPAVSTWVSARNAASSETTVVATPGGSASANQTSASPPTSDRAMTTCVTISSPPAKRSASSTAGPTSPSAHHHTSRAPHSRARRSTSARISGNGRGELTHACTRPDVGDDKCAGQPRTKQSSVRTTSTSDGNGQASSTAAAAASTSPGVKRSTGCSVGSGQPCQSTQHLASAPRRASRTGLAGLGAFGQESLAATGLVQGPRYTGIY